MLDTASKLIALIVASVGAITTIFNTFLLNEKKRKQAYYDCLLKPFVMAYKQDPDINPITFVQSIIKREDDNIPKYIFFLLDTEKLQNQENHKNSADLASNSEKLKKVLIDDYINLYPNSRNKKLNLFEAVQKVIDYLLFLVMFLCVIIGSFVMTSAILLLISFLFAETPPAVSDCWNNLKNILIGIAIAFAGLIPIKISEWTSQDMYTIKKSRIQKIISEKVDRYDSRIDEFVL